MKNRLSYFGCVTSIAGMLLLGPWGDQSAVAQDIVQLRTDCTGISNCYETMPDLTAWIWGTRHPSAGSPLRVDIGPGDFGGFTCPSATPHNGHVTLRGSGPDQTRIVLTSPNFINPTGAIHVLDCDQLTFEDFSVVSVGYGITWKGVGSSTWSNITVTVGGGGTELFAFGWYDITGPGCSRNQAIHYWFGSRIEVTGAVYVNTAYNPSCSTNEFYGGELEAELGPSGPPLLLPSSAVTTFLDGDMRVFGSRLRSEAGAYCGNATVAGATLQGTGNFEMHGGSIEVDAIPSGSCSTAMNAVGIQTENSSTAYVPAVGFSLRANGTGTAQRLLPLGTGRLQSPFTWPAGTEPPRARPGDPTSQLVTSTIGSDMYVETDCQSTGICSGSTQTHLMIYNPNCGAINPWFNATKGACRQP